MLLMPCLLSGEPISKAVMDFSLPELVGGPDLPRTITPHITPLTSLYPDPLSRAENTDHTLL